MTALVRGAVVLAAFASCKGGDGPTAIAVTSLRFVSQPASIVPGQAFSVTVELLGSAGTRATSAKDQVTISVAGTTTISGPAAVAAVAGLATFDGLIVTGGATTVQLTATSNGLAVSSAPLPYRAGPVALAKSFVDPAPCNMLGNVDAPLLFTFSDAIGNPQAAVPVTLSTNLTGATLTPASGVTTVTGTFASTLRMPSTGSAAITAKVDGNSITFAAPFVVVSPPAAPPPTPLVFPGTTTGSLSAVCVTTGSPFVMYQFAVAAQTGVSFKITAPFDAVFGVKLSAASTTDLLLIDTPPVTAEWLLPPATYFYLLQTATVSGAYTLQSTAGPGNSPAVLRFLLTGGTYSGQRLEAADRQFDDGSSFDFYIMRTTAPCKLTLRSSAFNPYFVVVDDITGTVVGIVPGSGVGVDAVITLPRCASGSNPIDILANSLNAGESGPYTLIVELTGPATVRSADAPIELTPIPVPGPSAMGTLFRASVGAAKAAALKAAPAKVRSGRRQRRPGT
jgi:hypothetical protein